MSEFKFFYTKLEQFHTTFGRQERFKSKTVVHTLADNAFKHQITLRNKTVPPINVSDPYVFNSSIDSKYNDTEFQGLLIDLDALTELTSGLTD